MRRFAYIALLCLLISTASAQTRTPGPRIRSFPAQAQQDDVPESPQASPIDDSALDDARNEVKSALPQLRHLLNQLEQVQADSGTCSEQVPPSFRSRYAEQMPALKKLLEQTESAMREVEKDPLRPDTLSDTTMMVDSARVVSLRWAALLPKCKSFQSFANEQVTLPLDSTDPVIVLRHALAQLADVRDKQVKVLRMMLENSGNRVQGY